jgi:pimeloyl-ACP methyl ester carboxylesterase
LNWYRLTEINFADAKQYASTPTIDVPMLFIPALRDTALPPSMGKSMGQWIPGLTVKQVNTSHWALTEDPRGVNESITSWLEGHFQNGGQKESSL